jgi:6-pyruvoyltetrahydropterin/6-carboxytetrahydropterin synthase
MDFYDLDKIIKPIIERWDHAFAINTSSRDKCEKELHKLLKKYGKKIIELPMRTTAENMAKYFFDVVQLALPGNLFVNEIIVYETDRCRAEYRGRG